MAAQIVELTPGRLVHHTGQVDVSSAEDGGWNVTAILDDEVVATQHFHDWHRVERARRGLELDLRRMMRRLPLAGALALWLLGGGLAWAQSTDAEGLLAEPRVFSLGIEKSARLLGSSDGGEVKSGFYAETSNMITGSGWLSAGPGYRHWLFGDRAFVEASAAYSWRSYKVAQTRFELRRLARSRLTVGAQLRWQDATQVTYFGEGVESAVDERSEYRLRTADTVGYATVRPRRWLAVEGQLGWLASPSVDSPSGTFRRGNPSTAVVFPDDPVYQLAEQPSFAHGGLSITADTRDHQGYPSQGGLFRAAWHRFDDRASAGFGLHRYEAEGVQFLPVADRRVVFALHGWLVASDVDAGATVPFYLLPSLGGANTLRSYTDFRFHDRQMLILNAESRVAIFEHVDAALFVDAGNVAARVGDLNLDQRAYGAGLRVHARQSTLVRLDVAHGSQGWQMVFRTSDPFRFSRLTRRTAPLPFVP